MSESLTRAGENLKKRGFTVTVFQTAAEACEYLCKTVRGTTVGFGGSVTLQEMGLYEKLAENNRVFWHWSRPEGVPPGAVIAQADTAEVYITSANALAETGEIVNIDAGCNRVASSVHGHKKVIFVIGENKLAENCEKAVYRARNVAAPLNAKRLHADTPCAVNGDRCYDCSAPGRICRNLSILMGKPLPGEFEVILIGEKLGY